MMTTRRRTLLQDSFQGEVRNFGLNPSYGVQKFPQITGKQVTVSEGHPFSSSKKAVTDIGGEFYTSKNYVICGAKNVTFSSYPEYDRTWAVYTGPLLSFPNVSGTPFPPPFPPTKESSNSQLDAKGATAIARCSPTNSVANAATFLGELYKDGLPALIGSQTWENKAKRYQDLGSEYLNVEFGWQPFLSDIQKFWSAVHRANTVMTQYERDAGKVVRRRYNFPAERSVTEVSAGSNTMAYFRPSDFKLEDVRVAPRGDWVLREEVTRRQWFSGAFSYYLPTGYDSRKAMERYALEADKVFGLSLTPDVLWELAPWSWAIDWFSNTGDVITNISNRISDSLVMRYGYMMEHTIVKHNYIMKQTGGRKSVAPSPITFVTETKKRRRANPYGFGVTWDGLSAAQIAILAALGISKS